MKTEYLKIFWKKPVWPIIIPLLQTTYYIFLTNLLGPVSYFQIDPEYLCLLNGLNISTLHFGNIGYTDLPGTPFLVLTGILLRIAHLFFGHGPIVEDVIAQPDFYIQVISNLFIVLTFIVLFWGGNTVYKATKNVVATIALQSSMLLSPVLINLNIRYSADRLLPLLVFLFSVFTIQFLYKKLSTKKYAIYAGIVLGIGTVTKINFAVLAVIPFFLLFPFKYWLTYLLSLIASLCISFLPIISKYRDVFNFISGLIKFDGKYGGGEERIFNFETIFSNLKRIPSFNIDFFVLLLISITTIIVLLFRKKKELEKTKRIVFLSAIILVTFVLAIMVSKHFKNYYMTPILSFGGIMFFLSYDSLFQNWIKSKRYNLALSIFFLLLFCIPSVTIANSHVNNLLVRIEQRKTTKKFLEKQIQKDDYLYFEPSWVSGPFEQNALLWGISYVAGKNHFWETYNKLYPNVLSWEGKEKPIKHFRIKSIQNSKLFADNTRFFLFSNPGRHTNDIITELQNQAQKVNSELSIDTIFQNTKNKDYVLVANCFKRKDSCKLSTEYHNFTYNIDSPNPYWGKATADSSLAHSQPYSLKLNQENKTSSIFSINPRNFLHNDMRSVTISCNYFQTKPNTSARIILSTKSTESSDFWYAEYCNALVQKTNSWEPLRFELFFPKNAFLANNLKIYFYNSAKSPVYIDDIKIELQGSSSK